MTPTEIETKVREILVDKLGAKAENVHLNSRLADDLGMDSFGAIEMGFELEEIFSIKIPDEDLAKAVLVKDIVDYVGSKINNTAA